MSKKKLDFKSYMDELPSGLYIVLAVLFMAIHILICSYSAVSPAKIGLILLSVYILLALTIFIFGRRRISKLKYEKLAADEHNSGVISAFRDSVDIPYVIVTDDGKVITANRAFREITGDRESYFNAELSELCSLDLKALISSVEEKENASSALSSSNEESDDENATAVAQPKAFTVSIAQRKYSLDCHTIRSSGHIYYMILFGDITELASITDRYYSETSAIAYIVIDNLDEIAQYVKGSYRAEENQVESILKNFAADMNGIIREYDRHKYMMIFDRKHLALCIKNKFSVLDEVRQVRLGDDTIPLTVSMGVAITGSTLEEREHDALSSLDLALQRGGDQVVVKNEKGINYFGGLTKSQQKRTRVHSRVIANKLYSEISNSSNVIVMGHRNPDFDCIGACVGIASLAMYLGIDVKIVTDRDNPNFAACTEKLIELEEYKNIFVDGVDGLDETSFGTLLVIVDANNFAILEAPEMAEKSLKTVVIDHHIKKEEFKNEPTLSYIDATASSACELVSEILEQSIPDGTLKKEEATVMLSGIMVDTKNFTRSVGTRTFSAALYLRAAGASTENARTFFNEAFEDYRAQALFGAGVEMYRDQLAITLSNGTNSPNDRIAAAKAADTLLTVRKINAAFALVKIENTIHISARSNGSINVQLILEKIGGGGHFDSAGAAIADKSLEEARALLIEAIDEHLDNEQKIQTNNNK